MKKRNRWITFWFALAVVIFPLVACQEDDIDCEGDETETVCEEDNDDVYFTLKKNLIRKYDTVYGWNADNLKYDKLYRTVKYYNTTNGIMQEWLLEDWHEKGFCQTYYARQNDSEGTKYGYYYPWEDNLTEIDNFDELFARKVDNKKIPVEGFHIPTQIDMIELDKMLGVNRVRERLNIKFDGDYSTLSNTWTWSNAMFWVDPRDYSHWPNNNGIDPDKVEGCGVLAGWFPESAGKGKSRWFFYTNDRYLCANVRFMRPLTIEQW